MADPAHLGEVSPPAENAAPSGRRRDRRFGTDTDTFSVPVDFDAPLPDDLLDAFGT